MAARASKTTPEADAATPVEAEVVEEKEAQTTEGLKFEAIKNLITSSVKMAASRQDAKVDEKLTSITAAIADLEALVTAKASEPAEVNPVAATLEEDWVHDMVDGAVTRKTEALTGELKALEARLDAVSREGLPVVVDEATYALKENVAALNGKAILSAIWKVMQDVTYVPKGGTYDDGKQTKYQFRSFDDTAAALGAAFRRHGVFIQSSVIDHRSGTYEKPYSNGGSQHWIERSVTMEYVFTSLIDGSTLTVQSVGEGRDTSDKAASKAMTMALKTALGQGFLLPTNEPDPDSERPGDDPTPPPARQQERQQHQTPEDYSQDQGQQAAAEAPQLTPDQQQEYAQMCLLVASGKKADAKGNWVRNQEDWGANYQKAQGLGLLGVVMPNGQTLQSELLAVRRTLSA